MGRITHDLELKTTPSGVPVLTFSIAVDRRYQEKGADKKSDFFNCIAWRNEAEFISRFWSKGRAILIEGELQNRKYTDKNNIERQITEIVVDRATFTGEKTEREAPPPPEEPPQYRRQDAAVKEEPKQMTADDVANVAGGDDYPF